MSNVDLIPLPASGQQFSPTLTHGGTRRGCVGTVLRLHSWQPSPSAIHSVLKRTGAYRNHSALLSQSKWAVARPHRLTYRSPAAPYKELRGKTDGQASAEIQERVEQARETQRSRGFYNAQIPPSQLRSLCALDESGERTLEMAIRRMNLSARAHDRLLRVARTIADLDHATTVAAKHLAEAVQFRNLDRNYWS
ncbi:MAG: hypothetical protein JO340_03105 [Acidobacteriaceae bacterium]|nr:hypothetical protein [Acidobacteriaceae bacterium]